MSNNEPIELISLSVKSSKHHCSKKIITKWYTMVGLPIVRPTHCSVITMAMHAICNTDDYIPINPHQLRLTR